MTGGFAKLRFLQAELQWDCGDPHLQALCCHQRVTIHNKAWKKER